MIVIAEVTVRVLDALGNVRTSQSLRTERHRVDAPAVGQRAHDAVEEVAARLAPLVQQAVSPLPGERLA